MKSAAEMDKSYKVGKKRAVADPDEHESESKSESEQVKPRKHQKKAGQKSFAGSKSEAMDNMLQLKALPSTKTKDKKVPFACAALTTAALAEREQTWYRVVEQVASHSPVGSTVNPTYQDRVEPAEESKAGEDEVKWEDWVNF
ncbi:hypothetical protein DV737_g1906, partial [Chaetothyriales sp. CBS 132003]